MLPVWLEVFAFRRSIPTLIARRRMDNIIEKEIERWLDWFETDVVPVVKYFRKVFKV